MDLSKLPKLSSSQEPPPAPAEPVAAGNPPPPVQYAPVSSARAGTGFGEAWISIGAGIFLLFWQPRFLQWFSYRFFHTSFNQFLDPVTNAVVPYQTLPEFWSDLGPTLFGIVLIIDGLLVFTRRRLLLRIALFLTACTVAFNLYWVVTSYNQYGFAALSALAVIFGVFIASTQWRMVRSY